MSAVLHEITYGTQKAISQASLISSDSEVIFNFSRLISVDSNYI